MTIKNKYKLQPSIILKTTPNYSPNFHSNKRNIRQVKFIIFHYTGMKKESAAIKKLTSIQSKVSSHYLIKYNGEIVTLVPDLFIAWHAGISSWKNFKSLNKNSIGIEISNPGHNFNYKKFSRKQINSLLKLSKFLIKKYKIKIKNILGHSDIAPNRKKDPGEKFPWKYLAKNKIGIWHKLSSSTLKKNRMIKVNSEEKNYFYNNLFQIGYTKKPSKNITKNRYLNLIVKAFQRRFRQELVNGKIDKECLLISENLLNKFD
jgi:N-acetylmuramoyl-L-alanine amidase